MRQKTVMMDAQSAAFSKDAADLLKKYQGILPPEYLLAIASKLLGKIMTIQDQGVLSFEDAMGVVNANMHIGMSESFQEAIGSHKLILDKR